MSDDIQNVEAAASANDTPAPVVDNAQDNTPATTESGEFDLRAELEKAFDKTQQPERPRDEHGRFAKAEGDDTQVEEPAAEQPEAKEQEVSGDQPEDTPDEQAKPAIEPPVSWSREMKEKWATLPPEVQEYAAQREREAHSQISQLGQAVRQYEPFARVLEQYRDDFNRRNVAPADGFAAMLEVQRKLDRDPYSAIQQIAGAYGVNLSVFGNADEGEGAGTTPQVASLLHQNQIMQAKLDRLEQEAAQRAQRESELHQQTVASEIDSFLSQHQVPEEQLSELADYVGYLTQTKPHLSPKDRLNEAYKRVVESNPKVIEDRLKQQQAAEAAKKAEADRKKAADAKKAASLNVKGNPAIKAPPKFKDLREELEWAYDNRVAS